MSTEQNKALARRYAQELEDFFRTGDLAFVDRLFTKDALLHMVGVPPNVDTKQIFSALRLAMPDFRTKIEDIVAEGDKVASVALVGEASLDTELALAETPNGS